MLVHERELQISNYQSAYYEGDSLKVALADPRADDQILQRSSCA